MEGGEDGAARAGSGRGGESLSSSTAQVTTSESYKALDKHHPNLAACLVRVGGLLLVVISFSLLLFSTSLTRFQSHSVSPRHLTYILSPPLPRQSISPRSLRSPFLPVLPTSRLTLTQSPTFPLSLQSLPCPSSSPPTPSLPKQSSPKSPTRPPPLPRTTSSSSPPSTRPPVVRGALTAPTYKERSSNSCPRRIRHWSSSAAGRSAFLSLVGRFLC